MLKTNWFYVLLSLSGQEQHGYGIMNDVLERTNGEIRLWPATLYRTIRRLIDERLIEESDKRPSPDLDDARRRYYRLTDAGKNALDAESDRLEELVGVLRKRRL